MIPQPPTPKQLKIRRLVKNFGQCVWCLAIANATENELASNLYFIPRPSLPHCPKHGRVNSEFTLALGRAKTIDEITFATAEAYRKGNEVVGIRKAA
jgi:hypothetical protein